MQLNEKMCSRSTFKVPQQKMGGQNTGSDQRQSKALSLLKCASEPISSSAPDFHTFVYNIDQSGNVDKTLEEHESLVGVVKEID